MLGKKFLLRKDHLAIKYFKDKKHTNQRIMQYALKLQEYEFNIQYIPGKTNSADYLSRHYHILTINKMSVINDENKKKGVGRIL